VRQAGQAPLYLNVEVSATGHLPWWPAGMTDEDQLYCTVIVAVLLVTPVPTTLAVLLYQIL